MCGSGSLALCTGKKGEYTATSSMIVKATHTIEDRGFTNEFGNPSEVAHYRCLMKTSYLKNVNIFPLTNIQL